MKPTVRFLCLILSVLCLFSLVSCAKQPDPETDPGSVDTPDPAPAPEPVAPKPTTNPLSGAETDEKNALSRPVSFMIDNELNYNGSLSVVGWGNAELVYETNIEANGSGTRIMAVFTPNALRNAGKVGSVRSARPYFMTLSKMLDAFYVHEGESNPDEAVPSTRGSANDYARGLLNSGYLDNYYLQLEGKISYKDPSLKSAICTVEVPQIAEADGVLRYLSDTYHRTSYQNDAQKTAFCFGENTLENGLSGESVKITFAPWNGYYTKSDFVYDADSGLYVRGQYLFGNMNRRVLPVDRETGKLLTYQNVFVLVTHQYAFDKDGHSPDDDYHIKIDLAGANGTGYYFTHGKYVKITWRSGSDSEPIRFYTESGEELIVNPGKTYVNLIHEKSESKLEIA